MLIPATVIGGLMIIRSASFIHGDLAMAVDEIREEDDDHRRRAADPDNVPVVQMNGVDFSYGNVQVLFDVTFEVGRGEVLALLGTNGAGKSTILRAIAGLNTPSRGVVRFNGRTITYASPEQRVRMGIVSLAGGEGVFPSMTVGENLTTATFVYRRRARRRSGADRRASWSSSRCWPSGVTCRRDRCRAGNSRCSRWRWR